MPDPAGIKSQYLAYKGALLKKVEEALKRGDYILGKEVSALEETLKEYVGTKYCLVLSSGSDALYVALLALGVGERDEVICPPFTFVATVSAIIRAGATPVFADIQSDTYLIDPLEIAKKITPNTKGILAVSLFGQMPSFKVIDALAKKHSLFVLEDGAQSFGARQGDKKSGSVGDVGITSFFPTKPLGGFGDGGALFTNNEALFKQAKRLSNHGLDTFGECVTLGINARLDTLQAALLLAKWPYFEEELKKREEIARRYTKYFEGWIKTPTIAPTNHHIFAQYTLDVNHRDRLFAKLNKQNITARIYYQKPLHLQKAFAYLGYKRGDFPVAERAASRVLSVPIHPWLSEEEQTHIIQTLWTLRSLDMEGGEETLPETLMPLVH